MAIAAGAAAAVVLGYMLMGRKKVKVPKKIRLEYFNLEGTADKCRIAFKVAGIPFEDVRFTFSDWAKLKEKYPQRVAPVLYIDDEPCMSQSYALARYVGRITGLYPEDPLEALQVDQVCDLECDERCELRTSILFPGNPGRYGHPTDLTPEQKKGVVAKMRANLVDEKAERGIHSYWRMYERMLQDNGTGWFVGSQMTIADLTVLGTVRWLQSAILDGIPADTMKGYPLLNAHYRRMMAHPVIKEHFETQGEKDTSQSKVMYAKK